MSGRELIDKEMTRLRTENERLKAEVERLKQLLEKAREIIEVYAGVSSSGGCHV